MKVRSAPGNELRSRIWIYSDEGCQICNEDAEDQSFSVPQVSCGDCWAMQSLYLHQACATWQTVDLLETPRTRGSDASRSRLRPAQQPNLRREVPFGSVFFLGGSWADLQEQSQTFGHHIFSLQRSQSSGERQNSNRTASTHGIKIVERNSYGFTLGLLTPQPAASHSTEGAPPCMPSASSCKRWHAVFPPTAEAIGSLPKFSPGGLRRL